MTSSLNGRRIVVTGASTGIGLETARLLVREGARLVRLVR
jgi:NAD(P)-dependent dehydrogenase (short-subunit alcohol dehydrogenase family)